MSSGLLIRGYEAAGFRLYRYISAIWLPPAHATQRARQRRSRLRYRGQRPGPFPMFRAPGEKSDPRSQLSRHPCRTSGPPGAPESRPQAHQSYTPGQPRKRADPASSVCHARRDARRSGPPCAERQPACHPATLPKERPDRPTTPVALGRPAPANPGIHPPAQASPPAADRNVSSRCPPGTLNSRQARHSPPWASARLSAAREAGMGIPRTMSVAVRGKADGAHRLSVDSGRRPLYVRGHCNTSTHGDTCGSEVAPGCSASGGSMMATRGTRRWR